MFSFIRTLCITVMLGFSTQAAAFQLETLTGERVNVLDYTGKGRWTLVFFWSVDCIPCEKQKPMIEAFHHDHHDTRAQVLGIATDGMAFIEDINTITDRHNPSYPNLVVLADVFSQQYTEMTGKQFRVTPTYLLFNPSGEFAGVHTGPISRESLEAVVAQ